MPANHIFLRLSGFYWFYFASLGVFIPYWGLYLKGLGFGPEEIGALLAITLANKIVAPNVWGWIADRTGKRITIVQWACLATVVSFAGIYGVQGFAGVALVMVLFSFFWNAGLPQFEAITLNYLGNEAHRYSMIRLWGSVGFIVTALLGGELSQYLGVGIVPLLLWILFAALWLNSLVIPDQHLVPVYQEYPPLGQVLRQPAVISLFLACFLNQTAHGPYYAFFSLYLENQGYASGLIGKLWGLGVIAEVGMFIGMHRLLPLIGARQLMLASLALASLRWLLIGRYVGNLPLLLLAQCLHAFSFGVNHAVAIHLIHQFFIGPHQGRGQALYSSLSFGAGGAVGSLAAGYLWVGLGPETMYTLAAGLNALGWLVAWRGLRV